MIHASHDPKPPPRGDKPASYDTRDLRPTRNMIRNRLVGAINLPATIRAVYDQNLQAVIPAYWVAGHH